MEKVYNYMHEKGWKLQQVQGFIPSPMTLATAMYWTGIDPMSKRELFVAKEWKDRKIQQALLQPHKPEHKEILRDYRSKKRRDAVGFVQKTVKPTSAIGRAISNVPKKKLGPKLLLDSR